MRLKTTFLFALISLVYLTGRSQDFSKNTLKYDLGLGFSEGPKQIGGGTLLLFGYQRDLWKDRLRLNPNLCIGFFSSNYTSDVRDQWFNSINLEMNLYFDIVKVRAVSLVVGTGLFINHTKGLKGRGGEYYNANSASSYFNSWNAGGYLGGGIRINPKNSRFAFEFLPINVHIGNEYFMEGYAKIGIELKLK